MRVAPKGTDFVRDHQSSCSRSKVNYRSLELAGSTMRSLMFLILCLLAVQSTAGTLSGRVTDTDGAPLEGAAVKVFRMDVFSYVLLASRTTDADGRYLVPQLSGHVLVTIVPLNHVAKRLGPSGEPVTCRPPVDITICIRAQPGISIPDVGEVHYQTTTEPAGVLTGNARAMGGDSSRLRVSIRDLQYWWISSRSITPAADGSFEFRNVPSGEYQIVACANGSVCRDSGGVELDVFGADAPPTVVPIIGMQSIRLPDITLREGAVLSGALADDQIRAYPPSVYVHSPDSDVIARVSALKGFKLDRLRAGTYLIRSGETDSGAPGPTWRSIWMGNVVCDPECDPADGQPITLASGQTVDDLKVPIAPRQWLRGRVFDSKTMAPSAGVTVRVGSPFVSPTWFNEISRTTTNANGEFVLNGMSPGDFYLLAGGDPTPPYYLRTQWPRFRCTAFDLLSNCLGTIGPISIAQDQALDNHDFFLQHGGVIEGSVRHAITGQQIPNHIYLTSSVSVSSSPLLVESNEVLPAGVYYALARTASMRERFNFQLWLGIDCGVWAGFCPFGQGTRLILEEQKRIALNFNFDPDDMISRRDFE